MREKASGWPDKPHLPSFPHSQLFIGPGSFAFRSVAKIENQNYGAGRASSIAAAVTGGAHLAHEVKVQRVDRVGGLVIVEVSEIGGVGEHDGWVAIVPERGVVARLEFRGRSFFNFNQAHV